MLRKTNIKKRISIVFMLVFCIIFVSGCSDEETETPKQFTKEGKYSLARINIRDYGSISFRLYTDEEPELVEAFLNACRSGYYDGKPVYNIIEDYILMAGSETKDADKKVTREHSGHLYPFKGALCFSPSDDDKCNASGFEIVCIDKQSLADMETLIEHKGYTFTDYIKFGYETEITREELDLFMKYGGAPWLTGHIAVFGQAYDGLDVLDKVIASYEEDQEAEIIIDSIETN